MERVDKDQRGATSVAHGGESPRAPDADIQRIMDSLPHRYPFLMLDRLVDIVHGERAVGIKNVTIGEGFFQGHFPHKPLLPGVVVVEAMCQAAAVLVTESLGGPTMGPWDVYFMSIEGAKFRRPVVPGDQLRLHVEIVRHRATAYRFNGVARVDGHIVAEATFTAMFRVRTREQS